MQWGHDGTLLSNISRGPLSKHFKITSAGSHDSTMIFLPRARPCFGSFSPVKEHDAPRSTLSQIQRFFLCGKLVQLVSQAVRTRDKAQQLLFQNIVKRNIILFLHVWQTISIKLSQRNSKKGKYMLNFGASFYQDKIRLEIDQISLTLFSGKKPRYHNNLGYSFSKLKV